MVGTSFSILILYYTYIHGIEKRSTKNEHNRTDTSNRSFRSFCTSCIFRTFLYVLYVSYGLFVWPIKRTDRCPSAFGRGWSLHYRAGDRSQLRDYLGQLRRLRHFEPKAVSALNPEVALTVSLSLASSPMVVSPFTVRSFWTVKSLSMVSEP